MPHRTSHGRSWSSGHDPLPAARLLRFPLPAGSAPRRARPVSSARECRAWWPVSRRIRRQRVKPVELRRLRLREGGTYVTERVGHRVDLRDVECLCPIRRSVDLCLSSLPVGLRLDHGLDERCRIDPGGNRGQNPSPAGRGDGNLGDSRDVRVSSDEMEGHCISELATEHRLLDIDGRRVAIGISGAGAPPVVCLSSSGGAHEQWAQFVPPVQSATTCVTYGRPGSADQPVEHGPNASQPTPRGPGTAYTG